MAFPKTTKLVDKNTKVETRLENGSFITFVTSLDGTVEVFRSAPVPTTREAEVNHLTSVQKAEEGKVAYYETIDLDKETS